MLLVEMLDAMPLGNVTSARLEVLSIYNQQDDSCSCSTVLQVLGTICAHLLSTSSMLLQRICTDKYQCSKQPESNEQATKLWIDGALW